MRIFLIAIFFSCLIVFPACNNAIKRTGGKVVDEMKTDAKGGLGVTIPNSNLNIVIKSSEDLIGYWVGYFEDANLDHDMVSIVADDGLEWTRENKINISIDQITGDKVIGHSVDAGLLRPFNGTVKEDGHAFVFDLKEPGDNNFDGAFHFAVRKNDSQLNGTWKAFQKMEVPNRKYTLQKRSFKYDANQMLENSRRYANWNKVKKSGIKDEESNEDMKEFSTVTDVIYSINASAKLLTKTDVENLFKGDLLIIRNTIYARHGYTFKTQPLRVFFDAQSWYVPLNTNIKNELTEIEKKNIVLLLKYEKNAREYYDVFGR